MEWDICERDTGHVTLFIASKAHARLAINDRIHTFAA